MSEELQIVLACVVFAALCLGVVVLALLSGPSDDGEDPEL